MNRLGRANGQARDRMRDENEDLDDSCVGYYLSRMTDLITCCFPERREHIAAHESRTKDDKSTSKRSSKLVRMRKVGIPLSRYNPSICDEQPSRRSHLQWRASPDRNSRLASRRSRHDVRMAPMNETTTGFPGSPRLESEPHKAGTGQRFSKGPTQSDQLRQSGIVGDPNALINRPKSAYTRNLRTTDEEPVFWQHSHRATSRFRHSQFSAHRLMRPPSTRLQTEARRSNASDFESFLNNSFLPQSALHLQPNPVISIEAPKSPSLPPTPIEDPPIEDPQSPQETHLPLSADEGLYFPERSLSQKRFSGFRPLQLSFYLPGNRLSLLPRFCDEHSIIQDLPPVPGITRPASALIKDKASLTFNERLSSYSIPRKPVATLASSAGHESNRSSSKSSVTLVGRTSTRSSLLNDRLCSGGDLSHRSWSNKLEIQKDADTPLTPFSRPASRCSTGNTKSVSEIRATAQSLQLDTGGEDALRTEGEFPTIHEESCPDSAASSDSSVASAYPVSLDRPSAPTYQDYEFTGTTQLLKPRSATGYHDYEFVSEARHVPEMSKPFLPGNLPRVAPLFHSSTTSSTDCSDDDLPPPSKIRSSLGSSTLYHGESSSESDVPPVKTTLSIAFPSPTLQHRLSEWISRSASHVQEFAPQQGECYGHPDSPTLGFSWKDFGFHTGEDIPRSEGVIQQSRRRTFTNGSSTTTYSDGSYHTHLPKISVPVSMTHPVDVGIAF